MRIQTKVILIIKYETTISTFFVSFYRIHLYLFFLYLNKHKYHHLHQFHLKYIHKFILFPYSFNLCQSAICLRGELHTSFQWFNAEPVAFGPSSRRPMTSFFVTRSQSNNMSSNETPSSVAPAPYSFQIKKYQN